MAYQIALDIANRAIQHLTGVNRIFSLSDNAPAAREIAFAYDKVRDAELRRNLWRFAIRRAMLRPVDPSTVIWTPAAWAAATTYAAGAVVNYTPAGLNVSEFGANPVPYLWQAGQAVAGSASNSAPDIATAWHRYFGPVSCTPFVTEDVDPPAAPTTGTTVSGALAARTYYVVVTYITTSGETLVSDESTQIVAANSVLTVTSPIAATGATKYHVYIATTSDEETLQTGSGAITIGTDWTEPTTGMVLDRRPPIAAATPTDQGYFAGEITVLDATVYSSLVSSNTDVPPSGKWTAQGGTVAPLDILYPLDAGPIAAANTRNVFRLPAGFLRVAPLDPSADYNTFLGAPTGMPDLDWVLEGNYLLSRTRGPLLIAFIADVVDVYDMDPLFCEMVAARIAMEVAGTNGVCAKEDVGASRRDAAAHYFSERRQAYQANSLLVGRAPTPLNRYILARI